MSQAKLSRMTGYIRVSRIAGRESDSFISPDVQRKQITAWASMRGVEIVQFYEDLDVSGGTRSRPGLDAFLEDLRNGDTQGIVVARLDRLSRLGVGDALALVQEIHEAGGQITAIDLGIDPSTMFGEFAMTLMLGLARMERRKLSESWVEAKERANDRGVQISPTPFGYQRADDARLEPDPVYGPIVTEAFRLAAAGGVDAALAHLLEHGNGRTWTSSTVRRLLTKRSYLGEARYGDLSNLDAHPALVTRAIWEAAQPEPTARRRPKATFPLSGLASCAQCGNVLVGARGGSDARRTYRCSAALSTWKGKRCTSPTTVTAELLEQLVRTATVDALSDHTGFTAMDCTSDLTEAEDALRDAERELDDLLSDAALRKTLGADRFRILAQTTVQSVEQAHREYTQLARQSAQTLRMPTVELLQDAVPYELGELLRGVLDDIRVTRGRSPLAGRVQIIPKCLPADARVALG